MKTGGTVAEVFARDWEGRDGTVTLYSFQLDGDRRFYRTGTDSPVKKGDNVSFEFDGKGNVSDLVFEESAPKPAPRPAAKSFTRQAGGGGGFKQKQAEKDAYWSDKEQRDIAREKHQHEVVEPRITWASAQSDAVALVTAALQHDLLAFGNANKSAKLGLLLDYVDQVTNRFAAQRWNAAKLVADACDVEDMSDPEDREEEDNLD